MEVRQLPSIDQLWDYSNPAETRLKFVALFEDQQEHAPLDYLLEIQTQIARTHSKRAEFERAHEILDVVEQQLNNSTPIAQVRYLLERGRTYNSSGQKKKAYNLFVQAYEFGKKIQQFRYSVDAAHMVAIASETLEEKLKWNEHGLKEAQKSDDLNVLGWVGAFHNNMGWDLFAAKRYEEALTHFEKSREFYSKHGYNRHFQIAKWSIAKTYRFQGKIDAAFEIQSGLLLEQQGLDPSGYTYEELGELYLVRGKTKSSKVYFKKAYAILSQDVWLRKNEAERLARMEKLSQ